MLSPPKWSYHNLAWSSLVFLSMSQKAHQQEYMRLCDLQLGKLVDWIESQGGNVHPSLQCFSRKLPNGGELRGLGTKTSILEGELILQIPPQPELSTIFPYSTWTSQPSHNVFTFLETFYSFENVAQIARQISSKSESPEFSVISQWDQTNDLFFSSAKLLEEFAFLPLVAQIHHLRADILNSPECQRSTAACEVFTRFYLFVKSHAFSGFSGCKQTQCLVRVVPIAELMNTGTPEQINTAWSLFSDGQYVMRASKDIPGGSAVIDRYGGSNTKNAFWSFALTGTNHYVQEPHYGLSADDCLAWKNKSLGSRANTRTSNQRFVFQAVAAESCARMLWPVELTVDEILNDDADRDGRVTWEEAQKTDTPGSLFESIDANHDGWLAASEAKAYVDGRNQWLKKNTHATNAFS